MLPTLGHTIRRASIYMSLLAVAVAGLLLLTAGLLALRTNAQDNLRLMARSLVYTVEGALVFADAQEANAVLARLVQGEDVAQATVWDKSHATFAHWQAPRGERHRLGAWLATAMGMDWVVEEVEVDGLPIGRVGLRSGGKAMQSFVLWGSCALLGCMVAIGLLGHFLARRMLHSIVTPLQDLGRVARAVHRERVLGQRVALPQLVELRELGEHFNALLDELEARQFHLQQENMTLEHRAYHDALTGLKNRLYFELRLLTALREAAQTGGALALLFIDNDRFKQVNDTYGHSVGDELLVAVAQRMSQQVREVDLVARLGGDEFVVMLVQPGGAAQVQRLAQQIQQAVAQPLKTASGVELRPSITVGIAMYPDDGTTMEALMTHADQAMYAAKPYRSQRLQE